MRRLVEKYREKKMDLHIVFIELVKVYDKVLKYIRWRCLEVRGVLKAYIWVINDMYNEEKTQIRMV